MGRAEKITRDLEVFADKIARRPELIGVGGALRPSSGLKDLPGTSLPAYPPTGRPRCPPGPRTDRTGRRRPSRAIHRGKATSFAASRSLRMLGDSAPGGCQRPGRYVGRPGLAARHGDPLGPHGLGPGHADGQHTVLEGRLNPAGLDLLGDLERGWKSPTPYSA